MHSNYSFPIFILLDEYNQSGKQNLRIHVTIVAVIKSEMVVNAKTSLLTSLLTSRLCLMIPVTNVLHLKYVAVENAIIKRKTLFLTTLARNVQTIKYVLMEIVNPIVQLPRRISWIRRNYLALLYWCILQIS